MTEEEKKAIEDCKEFIEYLKNSGGLYYRGISIKKNIEILLNLIEKLKKETIPTKYYACDPNKYIECKKKHCYINGGECDATIDETKVKYINLEDYIPKDKIRKKLKAREEDRKDCDNSIIANNLLRDIYLLRELLEGEENEQKTTN